MGSEEIVQASGSLKSPHTFITPCLTVSQWLLLLGLERGFGASALSRPTARASVSVDLQGRRLEGRVSSAGGTRFLAPTLVGDLPESVAKGKGENRSRGSVAFHWRLLSTPWAWQVFSTCLYRTVQQRLHLWAEASPLRNAVRAWEEFPSWGSSVNGSPGELPAGRGQAQ